MLGNKAIRTRVIAFYNPCQPSKNSKGYTTAEQQTTDFESKGDFRSAQSILFKHLIDQVIEWKRNGEEAIICGNFSKNAYNGRFAARLQQADIMMTKQCRVATGRGLPVTFVTGSRMIDAVYATTGIEFTNAALLPKYGGIGDHLCFILDFCSASVIGGVHPNVIPRTPQKLNCYCIRMRTSYNKTLNELADRHQMFQRIDQLIKLPSVMSPAEFQLKLNRWDDELTDYMRRSENKCHKFKQNHIEWSPEVGVWIRRRSLLNECLGFKLGKWKGSSNMFQKCKVNKIGDPRIMTIDVVRAKIFICGKR